MLWLLGVKQSFVILFDVFVHCICDKYSPQLYPKANHVNSKVSASVISQ